MFGVKSGEIQEKLTVLHVVWKVSVVLRCHEADNTLKKPCRNLFKNCCSAFLIFYSAARNNKEKAEGERWQGGRQRERGRETVASHLWPYFVNSGLEKRKEQRPFTRNELMRRSDDVWTCAPRSWRILAKVSDASLELWQPWTDTSFLFPQATCATATATYIWSLGSNVKSVSGLVNLF